ncbi:MAG TPA: DUF2141 domain-containing protein [Allosphingosinicella sp.]|jgi:uncharacterized protein (DUF2141 family)
MIILMLAAAPLAPPPELEVNVERLRNGRGLVHLCLTRNPAHFPDCGSDPGAVKRSVDARLRTPIRIAGIAPGAWALSVIHDENGNGKLDTMIGIPREGFGFSRNPTIRFGPPRFGQVRFDLGGGIARQTVRMQYLL